MCADTDEEEKRGPDLEAARAWIALSVILSQDEMFSTSSFSSWAR
jgi:hypothetical protein